MSNGPHCDSFGTYRAGRPGRERKKKQAKDERHDEFPKNQSREPRRDPDATDRNTPLHSAMYDERVFRCSGLSSPNGNEAVPEDNGTHKGEKPWNAQKNASKGECHGEDRQRKSGQHAVAEFHVCARQDSNLWPLASEASALIQLSYGRAKGNLVPQVSCMRNGLPLRKDLVIGSAGHPDTGHIHLTWDKRQLTFYN